MINHLRTSTADLISAVAGARVLDLGRPMFNGMPQSPNHPTFRHCLDRRHGDRVRDDGGSAAADLLAIGLHVGTHVDALAHVSHDGLLFGGVDAGVAQTGGRFDVLGIDQLAPFVGRGVLLDIPRLHSVDVSEPGYEITVRDLERAQAELSAPVGAGDAVLIRSGWGVHFSDADRYRGTATGVPGVGEPGARWLADRGVAFAGADTIAFECLPPGAGHASLPAHRVLLVESGINIIEAIDLEPLAAEAADEFVFVLAHLNIVGGTGAPARPLALIGS